MAQLVALRYAQALYELALANGSLDACLEKLEQLAVYAFDREFITVMKHPCVTNDEKFEMISNILGENPPDEIAGFFNLLVVKGRMGIFCDILEAFKVAVEEHRKVFSAHVYSARGLNTTQLEKIKALLEKRYQNPVNINVHIDHGMIGGLRIRVGDDLVETSIKKDIVNIRNSLLGHV